MKKLWYTYFLPFKTIDRSTKAYRIDLVTQQYHLQFPGIIRHNQPKNDAISKCNLIWTEARVNM